MKTIQIYLSFVVSAILIYLVDLVVTFVFLNLQNNSLELLEANSLYEFTVN